MIEPGEVRTAADLGRLLRQLRRREARRRGESPPTYRQLAARTGWSLGAIGEYFAGKVLPPTDRFDVLVRLLGAAPAEQGALATIRDRVEEWRRIDPEMVRPAAPVARELPPDVSAFTGRFAPLAELDRRLAGDARGGAVPIAVVSGMAGVGKTALALHWAHRVADRFPDGQLYTDLRGYDSDEPADAGEVLAGFLRGLGLDGSAVPADRAERAARYRTRLAGRRVLIVLDNARSAEQVRPLLPGSPSCFVLVTSRDDLAGLVARDGAHRLVLDPFPAGEAVTLLRTLVGARVNDEAPAANELAERCGYLPLALRLAAELAASRPGVRLTELLADLNVERLALLDAGGDPRAARTVFSWSIRHLTAPAARAFVLLGLHPGRDFDRAAVAAFTQATTDEAVRTMDELARAHVIASTGHRYAMHDLMRAYAAERAEVDVEPGAARAALTRLFDHYVAAAAAADAALYPNKRNQPDPPEADPSVTFDGPGEAQRWLDDERPNLVAVCLYAAAHGWPRHSGGLSEHLFRYLDAQGRYQDAAAVHGAAHRAARSGGPADPAVLHRLGLTCNRLGRPDDSVAYLEEALAGYRRAGDRGSQGRMLLNLGATYGNVGRQREALDCLVPALAAFREVGDRSSVGMTLGNLGESCLRLGRYAEAAGYLRQAVAIQRELGDRWSEAYALAPLGLVHGRTGDHARAIDLLERSLDLVRAFKDHRCEAEILTGLAEVYRQLDRHPDALERLHRAEAIANEIGDPSVEVAVHNGLGDTLRARGEVSAGLARHRSALALARRIGDRYHVARALDGIAHAQRETGHDEAARRHWRQALDLFDELGVPEAEPIRTTLAA